MARDEHVLALWEAWSRGDFDALATGLAPDARWRAVEDGPWNCADRAQILALMRENRAAGRTPTGTIEEITDLGERTLVGFRPDREPMDGWRLDNGIRYMVLTFQGDLVTEMKGCASRQVGVDYAAT
jgi:ketosteroid isomerase-like protein